MKDFLVCGSRLIESMEEFEDQLTELLTSKLYEKRKYKFLVGDSRGVNLLSEQYALKYGIKTFLVQLRHDKYGKKANYIRNQQIAKKADRAIVILYRDVEEPKADKFIDLLTKNEVYIDFIYIDK